MASSRKTKSVVSSQAMFDQYLSGADLSTRLEILASMEESPVQLPVELVGALFNFELSVEEKVALLGRAASSDPDGIEVFIFEHIAGWSQELAARSLRVWVSKTQRRKHNELVRILSWPGIPQRVLYTILDISVNFSDPAIVQACVRVARESIVRGERWSQALMGLLYMRMIQFEINCRTILNCAKDTCETSIMQLVPADKSTMAAWLYLWRFDSGTFTRNRERLVSGSPVRAINLLPSSADLSWLMPEIAGGEALSDRDSERPLGKKASKRRNEAGEIIAHVLDAIESCTLTSKGSDNHSSDNSFDSKLLEFGSPVLLNLWNVIKSGGEHAKWDEAVNAMRLSSGIYRLALIRCLGNHRQDDRAVLKLLDFIRSETASELYEVARALVAIGSPRAIQELISMFSRHNAGSDLQIEIVNLLRRIDLTNHQDALIGAANHLKNVIRELRERGQNVEREVDALDAMTGLLNSVAASGTGDSKSQSGNNSNSSELNLTIPVLDAGSIDEGLIQKIPHYEKLSAEVKRALRTAWYFDQHIKSSGIAGANSAIDLSPVIDMQYKALELLFREYFEGICSRVIHQGVIQRRLDLIGYSRPIHEKMDEFENFIAALPGIKEIPFFSKFKLRKMLLALCQFRPGRRFTLDGLKAFGLFFVTFGRSDCRYGLAGILPIIPGAFSSEAGLADFCRALHVFQDFRNRAAHEGFHPDVAADLDSIWRSTAEIIQSARKILGVLESKPVEQSLVRERAS